MALVTIQRSPSPSVDPDSSHNDSSEDFTDGKPQMRKSLSQSYFTVKGAALILPHTEFTKKSAKKTHGGEIQNHLQAMLHLLRPEDTIKIAIRLEDTNQYQRYMALVSTRGRQDTEEAVILGIDCNNTEASIGLVLPLWMGVKIKLGGDGGFSLCTDEQCYLFKPVSVQAMWSVIQSLVKVQHIADEMKYIPEGLTHTWIGYYRALIDRRDSARTSQWNVEGVEVFVPSSFSKSNENDEVRIKWTISQTLKEVMMTVDLDEATSLMLRKAVEEKMGISLTEFKSYFDEEVMRILGQMDEASEILDFLYLGSEWNASNLDELLDKGIGYILNVTKEIDNFFEDRFHYYNVRLYDEEGADLLKHWDKTYKFISKARNQKSKVLVHCKMGVSRSASTVMAFIMKENRWSVEEAFKFVKGRRGCVHPNAGFMEQLRMYEGILTASNKRDIFRSKSNQNLLDEDSKEETEPSQGSFLGDSLFHMMSHSDWQSACGGVAPEEEWIGSLQKNQVHDSDLLQLETDFETESRSADSMEEALPDMPSPPPDATEEGLFAAQGFMTPLATSPSVGGTGLSSGGSSLDTASLLVGGTRLCSGGISLDTASPLVGGTRLFSGGSLMDTEITTTEKPVFEREVSSESNSSFKNLATGSSLSSRIKPDSSWIKLEELISTEQGNNESHLPYNETVPSDDTLRNIQPNAQVNAVTNTNNALIPHNEIPQESVDTGEDNTELNPAMTTVLDSLIYSDKEKTPSETDLVQKTMPQAQFYISNVNDPLNINPTVPPLVLISPTVIPEKSSSFSSFMTLGACERALPSLSVTQNEPCIPNLQEVAVKQESLEEISQLTCNEVAERVENSDNEMLENTEDVKKSERANTNSLGNFETSGSQESHTKILELPSMCKAGSSLSRKHNVVPHTPLWSIEQTQDLLKTRPRLSEEFQQYETMDTDINETYVTLGESLGACGDQILESQPTTVPSHSHSIMEVCAQEDGDPSMMSLYERENIPLTPGTVLRTKYEIEERHKLIVGEDDPSVFGSTHPVLRTSSLKQDGNTHRSRYTLSRRLSGPVLSSLTGKPLDESPTPEVQRLRQNEIRSSKYPVPNQYEELAEDHSLEPQKEEVLPQSPQELLPGATPVTRTQIPFLQNIQSSLQTDKGNPADDRQPPKNTSPGLQPRSKGNFDSETLALIREIGSALLMSPTPQKPNDDEEEPCNNMVKYLVRKIEKQAKISVPSHNSVHADSGRRKLTSNEIDAKFLPTVDIVYQGNIPSASRSVPTIVIPKKTLDFLSVSAKNLSEDQNILSSQSDTPKTSCAYTNTDTDSPTRLDPDTKCQQVPDMEPVNVHYITPTSFPTNKAEPLTVKSYESASDASLSLQNYSYGHDPSEPSIVRHLVGRFETNSPSSENSSFEFGHDNVGRSKDLFESSLAIISSDQKNLRESDSVHSIRSCDDSSNQACSSGNNFFLRQIASQKTLNFPSSSNPTTTLLVSQPPQPLTSDLNQKVLFKDSDQKEPGVAKKHYFTSGIDVDFQQLPYDAEALSSKVASSLSVEQKHFSSVKSWKPNSPNLVHRSVLHSGQEPSSSDIHQRIETRPSHSDLTDSDDISMRQVSSEGRKIRRLHGKSHPLTKLSQQGLGRGLFYSSM